VADEPTLAVETGGRSGELIDDRYRLLRLIGAGGMGEVYEAEHLLVGKHVAVKLLSAEHSRDADQIERFDRETRIASMVDSPHIVDIMDAGKLADGTRYFVMELLRGATLAKELEVCGPLPLGRAVALARQIAIGLAAAHAAGIVHRDLKPDNIFLVARSDRADHIKILDFGVSKIRLSELQLELTRTGIAIGTPMYMSPEQSEGARDVDPRTDLWSLGVILFRMLTGEPPFTAPNYARLMIKIVTEPAPRPTTIRPGIPAALEQLVMQCLEKEPKLRHASADALIRALDAIEAAGLAETSATPAEPAIPVTLTDSDTPRDGFVPRPVLRMPTPPPRVATPTDLPFDEVVLGGAGGGRRITAAAFFQLPLSERIQQVIARTVTFIRAGVEVDRQEALAKMRVRSAK
jgi:serine/threonine-protein kinase